MIGVFSVAAADGSAADAVVNTARRAEVLLLAQDLADGAHDQVQALRRMLAAAGIHPVPQPLPIAFRPRNKGGLSISGTGDGALHDDLVRWCRASGITHADVVVRQDVRLPDVPIFAAAAWRRSGGARARQAAQAADAATFRPALVVGTRYDELDSGQAGATEAEERLRALASGFGCVAVSVFDAESVERLRAALAALAAG
jgi:hypothetical protein